MSGDVTLDQLLVSLRVYAERDGMIEYVAFRLFQIVELGHVPSLHNELVQVGMVTLVLNAEIKTVESLCDSVVQT